MSATCRIHPALGIARLGDGPDDHYLGPETPGVAVSLSKPASSSATDGKHRDGQQRIKLQGARFRIYEYASDESGMLQPVREITAAEAEIQWDVQLSNRKAASPQFNAGEQRNAGVPEERLIIDRALAGDIAGAHAYGRWLDLTFTDFMRKRTLYYRQERRWPESEFWRRRQ